MLDLEAGRVSCIIFSKIEKNYSSNCAFGTGALYIGNNIQHKTPKVGFASGRSHSLGLHTTVYIIFSIFIIRLHKTFFIVFFC